MSQHDVDSVADEHRRGASGPGALWAWGWYDRDLEANVNGRLAREECPVTGEPCFNSGCSHKYCAGKYPHVIPSPTKGKVVRRVWRGPIRGKRNPWTSPAADKPQISHRRCVAAIRVPQQGSGQWRSSPSPRMRSHRACLFTETRMRHPARFRELPFLREG